jgi:hypothetical protein
MLVLSSKLAVLHLILGLFNICGSILAPVVTTDLPGTKLLIMSDID